MTERRADDATREVEAWLKCEFLNDKVGEAYDGVIAAVTNFGIFVELVDLYIEGLVHISALPGDYYHFDQPKQRLVGEHTRRTFQLGGAVRVRVARVDLDNRKIDLEMEAGESARPSRQPGKKNSQTKGRGRNKGRAGASQSTDSGGETSAGAVVKRKKKTNSSGVGAKSKRPGSGRRTATAKSSGKSPSKKGK